MLLFLTALFVVPRFVRPAATAASFGQAIVRANYILFGVAAAQNLYGEGNVGILMLMGAAAIPVFNILSTIIWNTSAGIRPARRSWRCRC